MADDPVGQFHALAMNLVEQAIEYAKAGEYNADVDASIRQVRIVTQVLMSALQQAQIARPFVPPGIPSP
jgi:hypothetical protein